MVLFMLATAVATFATGLGHAGNAQPQSDDKKRPHAFAKAVNWADVPGWYAHVLAPLVTSLLGEGAGGALPPGIEKRSIADQFCQCTGGINLAMIHQNPR